MCHRTKQMGDTNTLQWRTLGQQNATWSDTIEVDSHGKTLSHPHTRTHTSPCTCCMGSRRTRVSAAVSRAKRVASSTLTPSSSSKFDSTCRLAISFPTARCSFIRASSLHSEAHVRCLNVIRRSYEGWYQRFGRMSSEQERRELDEKARRGETVVPGGTGGKSLDAQERLAEGLYYIRSYHYWTVVVSFCIFSDLVMPWNYNAVGV